MENQLLKSLQNNKLFNNVDLSKIDLNKVRGKLLTLQEGQILYREGDTADIIYLLISGEINVLKKKLLGKSKSDVYGENEFFGHDEYFEETSRTSAAVAIRDTYLIALYRDEIDYLIQCDDEVIVNLREPNLQIDESVLMEMESDESAGEDNPDREETDNTTAIHDAASENTEEEPKSETDLNENLKLEWQTEARNAEPDDDKTEDLDDALFKLFSDRETTPVYAPEKEDVTENKATDEFSPPEEKTDDFISSDFPENIMPENDGFSANDSNSEDSYSLNTESDNHVSEDDAFFAGLSFDNSESAIGANEDENSGVPAGENETFNDDSVFNDISGNSETTDGQLQDKDDAISDEVEDTGAKINFDEIFADDDILREAESKLVELQTDKTPKIINESKSSFEGGGQMTTDQLHMIIKAAELVNSTIRIDEALKSIVDVASNLTTADRGTLYLVDREKNEMWSMVAMGNETREIRLKVGEGLAGYVGKTGEVINIADVQKDSRFNSEVDKATGYKTKNMICFPIKNKEGIIIGVLQLLNSARGEFTKGDEEFLNAISIHSAIALQNAEMVEKLLQSERVHSLGKMANFLIQDIKKPILVSKRYTEHLKTKSLSGDVVQVVDMLLEQLSQVADLVQTTSSYSEGKTMLRLISASVNSTLNDFSTRIGAYVESRNCQIIHELDKDATVKLDVKEFYQCYNHIIKNACDAMPDGGAITITTKREDKSIKILFHDKGMGIPEGFKDKIFEPFMSLGKKEGTGLGLAITRKIIEAHNGTITAESILGEGSTFTVTLPVSSVI